MERSQPAFSGRQTIIGKALLLQFVVKNNPTFCRPLSRASDYLAINLGFHCAPPQALCCHLLRRFVLYFLGL